MILPSQERRLNSTSLYHSMNLQGIEFVGKSETIRGKELLGLRIQNIGLRKIVHLLGRNCCIFHKEVNRDIVGVCLVYKWYLMHIHSSIVFCSRSNNIIHIMMSVLNHFEPQPMMTLTSTIRDVSAHWLEFTHDGS